jgi:hypothetical protein
VADFQEPEVEICASMMDALNECIQVCTSIYEVGVHVCKKKKSIIFSFFPLDALYPKKGQCTYLQIELL